MRGSEQQRSLARDLLVLPGFVLILICFAYPLLGIILRSFNRDGARVFRLDRLGLSNYAEILRDPAYVVILRNTFVIAAVATVVAIAVAYPTCYLLSRLPRRWGARLLLLALFPFWTSILVRLYAFTQILPLFGIMYTTTGTIVGMVYYLLPYAIAVLYANMVTIDDESLNAAHTLGATTAQALLYVFVPLSQPGVFVAAVMLFVISLGFFLTPALLGAGSDLTIATYIQQQVNIANWGTASAMGTVLLVLTLGLFFTAARLFATDDLPTLGSTSQKGVARNEPIRLRWPIVVSGIVSLLVFVFLLAPLVIVVMVSFTPTTYLIFPPQGFSLRWYADFFNDPDWISSAWLSVRVALLTTAVTIAIGLLTAIGLERAPLRGKQLIRALFLAPLIVPVILIAVSFYDFANRLHLAGSLGAYVIGHTLLALPIAVMVIGNALRSIGTELELAAQTLGASPRYAFVAVTARLVAPSLVVSGLFAFVTSWDEPVIALFLSTGETTLPVHIFNYMQSEVRPTVAAVATMLMALVLVAGTTVHIASAARRRRLEAPVAA
jgi:putative spermidine/putrescine transport system permease protein